MHADSATRVETSLDPPKTWLQLDAYRWSTDPVFYGLWTLWSRHEYFDPDPLVQAFGNLSADVVSRFIESLSRASRTVVEGIGAYGHMWKNVARENLTDTFLAASRWVDDGIPFPGEPFRQWIRDFYHRNKLLKGELRGIGWTCRRSSVTS